MPGWIPLLIPRETISKETFWFEPHTLVEETKSGWVVRTFTSGTEGPGFEKGFAWENSVHPTENGHPLLPRIRRQRRIVVPHLGYTIASRSWLTTSSYFPMRALAKRQPFYPTNILGIFLGHYLSKKSEHLDISSTSWPLLISQSSDRSKSVA